MDFRPGAPTTDRAMDCWTITNEDYELEGVAPWTQLNSINNDIEEKDVLLIDL